MTKRLLTNQDKQTFLETLWAYYAAHGRTELPWRLPEADGTYDPYKILVSELMLQQTQVARVLPKFEAFLHAFPTEEALARAPLGAVLTAWQGLGYNRRAKFLWQTAQAIHEQGAFPSTEVELVQLPGVGVNTAGAILAYAFNKPAIFIETNVRTVYIHHFFAGRDDVSDKEIRELLEQTVDTEQPREFYWALMDYGAWLKPQVRNNASSKHYARQSTFEGSRRQLRGRIIRQLSSGPVGVSELRRVMQDPRFDEVVDELMRESMIVQNGSQYRLS